MDKNITLLYFSATGTTKKIVTEIGKEISKNTNLAKAIRNINFTLPKGRKEILNFTQDDLVIVGVPVYAGRVPNFLLEYLQSIQGKGALAVAVVLYGNRDYDDALIELKDILEADDFKVIAGGAFIGEHSFSKIVAQDRPDENDLHIARNFAKQIYSKLNTSDVLKDIEVKGKRPYKKIVVSQNIFPFTNDNCIDCKLCVSLCPMGAIDYEDVSKVQGVCVKCCACVKYCPTEAKHFTDKKHLELQNKIETNFIKRKEPEIFF